MARERDYELGLVLSPDTNEEDARAIIDRITQQVTTQDGTVIRVSAWGRRRLAYPIAMANKHYREGIYFFFDMQLPTTAVAQLDQTLRVNETIIRYLIKARDAQAVAEERVKAAEDEVRQRELAVQQAAEAEANAERLKAEQAAAEQAAADQATAEVPATPEVEEPASEEPVEAATPADTEA
jgi:small subunit ribosomal protein S6